MLLDRSKIGVNLRVFARTPDVVPKIVKILEPAVERLENLRVDNHRVFSEILITPWADRKHYGDLADCGETAPILREHFKNHPRVNVREVRHGGLYCACFNYAIASQLRRGMDYTLLLSPQAYDYITKEVMAKMIVAAEKGARAIGVAIHELAESIYRGRLANTAAMWHNLSLMTVGGFDLIADHIRDERQGSYKLGYEIGKGQTWYPLHGVEEMIPLARMVDTFGDCIAPISPSNEAEYLDALGEEVRERNRLKMDSKLMRQVGLLARLGNPHYDITFLQGGVMESYRNPKLFG